MTEYRQGQRKAVYVIVHMKKGYDEVLLVYIKIHYMPIYWIKKAIRSGLPGLHLSDPTHIHTHTTNTNEIPNLAACLANYLDILWIQQSMNHHLKDLRYKICTENM